MWVFGPLEKVYRIQDISLFYDFTVTKIVRIVHKFLPFNPLKIQKKNNLFLYNGIEDRL